MEGITASATGRRVAVAITANTVPVNASIALDVVVAVVFVVFVFFVFFLLDDDGLTVSIRDNTNNNVFIFLFFLFFRGKHLVRKCGSSPK